MKQDITIIQLGINDWNPNSKNCRASRVVDRFLLAIKRKNWKKS